MQTFFLINLLAFIVVVLYGLFLFLKAASTRVAYIKVGKKSEFDGKIKERLRDVWMIVFGQTKLLKDKKSGIIHVLMFYGFIFCSIWCHRYVYIGTRQSLAIWTNLSSINVFPRIRHISDFI